MASSMVSSAAVSSVHRTSFPAQAPSTGLSVATNWTLSYLPPLSAESLAKEVDYFLRNNWVPTLEFELELPLFGCTDSSQVLKELEEAKTSYPESFIRIIGFDNIRQTQCVSFIAYKPPGF
ncbi:unnamed protein product [Malus baccata var. baccata]